MASQNYLDDLPEVVLDSRLEAVFGRDGQRAYTEHPEYADPRASSNHERWFLQRRLGSGGGGRVDLEVKESRSQSEPPQLRAVKKVEISSMSESTNFINGSWSPFSNSPNQNERYIHISMEYLELGDLQGYLSDEGKCPGHRLPEPEVHDISVQILHALNVMHSVGFSHRDLKPANILIKSQPPQEWRVKLADFGISKRGSEITESTNIRGTRNFMAPELLVGGKDKPEVLYSFAIDMWCFGQTIYRMMTGHNPFDSFLDLAKYWEGNTELPTTALKSLDARESMINFLRSLMMANPTNRLTAKDALRDAWIVMNFPVLDLGRSSNTKSNELIPQPPPATTGYDIENEATASWTDVLPTRTSAFKTEISTQSHVTDSENSASWTEALGYSAASPSRTATQTEIPPTNYKTSHERLYGISHQILIHEIWDESTKCSVSERAVCAQQHEDVNTKLKRLGAEHPATISSMHALGLRLSEVGLNKPAVAVLRAALKLENKTLGEEKTQTLQTKRALATTLEMLEEYGECEIIYRELVAADKKHHRTAEPAAVQTLQSFGLFLYQRRKFQESTTVYEQCAAILKEKNGQEDLLLETLENLIRSANAARSFTNVVIFSREYIFRHKSHVKRADEKILAITYLLASNLDQMDRHYEAEIAFRDARTILRMLPDSRTHSLSQPILWGLGKVLFSQKKYPESELAMNELIRLFQKPKGPEDLGALWAKSFLALILEDQAKYDEAVLLKEEVVWETERICGPWGEQIWEAKQGLGQALMKANRLSEAETVLRQVAEEIAQAREKGHLPTLTSNRLLARVQVLRLRRER
ncbi:unnamed protein product [Clonostachys rosea]|uniref:Protein kinase domain-containing protein n=1 Tax=Bionectria ochroleuca TaxID=29856 RepID=A0ABY6U2Q1_BIOOC|nr:unnamed protein product [Clonostachys rosea]